MKKKEGLTTDDLIGCGFIGFIIGMVLMGAVWFGEYYFSKPPVIPQETKILQYDVKNLQSQAGSLQDKLDALMSHNKLGFSYQSSGYKVVSEKDATTAYSSGFVTIRGNGCWGDCH